jgi:hypothetical protein
MKIITGQGEPVMRMPLHVRLFGWSMICVHLQQLNWIAARHEEGGRPLPDRLVAARDYITELMKDGPDSAFFTKWCHEAFDMADDLIQQAEEKAAEEVKETPFRVIPGGITHGE